MFTDILRPALLVICLGSLFAPQARAWQDEGNQVVVLYNSSMSASKDVADHYAQRRKVPPTQVIGLPMPTVEAITRADFVAHIEKPLIKELKDRQLIRTTDEIRPATDNAPGQVVHMLQNTRVRTMVVCHGVPLRVMEDASLREPNAPALPDQLRRNEAAVDAELTVLPLLMTGVARTGPIANIWNGATNSADLNPLNGVFVVGRLDGPTPPMAKALVDRAMEAEENGLLGRGYFDIRGLSDPTYGPGDTWISNAWLVAKAYGFDTHLDTRPETLPTGFPLSHVALYAGWYDAKVSGPFAESTIEFMPGAVAYHLHSFSAATLRSADQNWVGPLIARGVTATMGTVAEPYLDGTPDIGLCLARFVLAGYSWGEAALASQRMLSWQLTVIGDPLYRPFTRNAIDRAKDLASRQQGRVDWALITLYNRKRAFSGDLPTLLRELEEESRLRFSPILQEKYADWLIDAERPADALEWYQKAAGLKPSPQQRKRLLWQAADAAVASNQPREAHELLATYARDVATPPNPILLYERLAHLARELGRDRDLRRWTAELERLRPPVPPPAK
jgi:uncharacterized protein (TIGR03790 family)